MPERPSSQNPHDALFRGVFADPLRAGELLRSVLPAAVPAAIDWTSLGRVDGSFVDAELRDHHADLLFTARARGRPVLLYLLLEHKSGDERFAALQLLRYVLRIWEAFRSENPAAERLPPVLPVVVHHGLTPWRSPRDVRDLLDLDDLPGDFAALAPTFPYLLDDLAATDEAGLQQRRLGIQSLLVLLHLQQLRRQAATAALLLTWRHLHLRLLAQPGGRAIVDRLVSYVAAVSDDDRWQLASAYRRIHTPIASDYMTVADQFRQEGRLEGRVEGRVAALTVMLEQRFGSLPPEAIDRIRAADEPTLDRWTRRVLTAASLDELLA